MAAILKCRWVLDEGSGLTVADTSPAGYNNTGTIYKVGDYPKWVTASNGRPAIENDGSYIGRPTQSGPRITTQLATYYDLGCNTRLGYWSMYAKAMLPVGAPDKPRVIMGMQDPAVTYTPSTCAATLYTGYGGIVGFGMFFYFGATREARGIATPTDMRDGEWHEYLAIWDDSFQQPNVTGYEERARLRLFVDNVEVAYRVIEWFWSVNDYILGSVITIAWGVIGEGSLYGEDFPGTDNGTVEIYGGAMYGQVQDCRFYCGAVTPEEIWPPPSKISSIMFSCNT